MEARLRDSKTLLKLPESTSLRLVIMASGFVYNGKADPVVEAAVPLDNSARPPLKPITDPIIATFSAAPAPPPSLPPLALPTGEKIVGGSAVVSRPETGHMNIHQSTDRAAINWKIFDAESQVRVHIEQPNTQFVILNCVENGKLSEISGSIEANGKFILENPNGIICYEGSKSNVNSISASTQDLDPKKFMEFQNLQLNFQKALLEDSGIVVEKGSQIKVADSDMVYFVSPFVRNKGAIVARPHKTEADPMNIRNDVGTATPTMSTGKHSFEPAALDSFVLPFHESLFSAPPLGEESRVVFPYSFAFSPSSDFFILDRLTAEPLGRSAQQR